MQHVTDKLKAGYINELEDFAELSDNEWKNLGVEVKPLLRKVKAVLKEMQEEHGSNGI